METKNILILEDEFVTQTTLSGILTDRGYHISGMAMSAKEAIAILEIGKTDLAILDIKVKGDRDGIWVAEQIRKKYHIPYLFLTAYKDDDTLKHAIDTIPAGYLVKPFDDNDVFASVEVALKNHEAIIAERKNAAKVEKREEHLFIKSDHLHVRLDLNNIVYMQSSRNYVELFLEKDKKLIRKPLKDFLLDLPQNFVQVHRSYAINIQKMDSFGAGFIRISGHEVPLSEKYRSSFLEKMKLL